jgi:hypothetical protein
LELEVPVYNINKGKNAELFTRSEKLKHYAEFIAKLREFQKTYEDYSQAVKETVNYCIENGILAKFLKEHGGRIVSILFAEYNEETAKRVYAEERIEEAVEAAVEEAAQKMIQDGVPIEKIVKYFDLTMEAVERLRKHVPLPVSR